MQYDGDVCDVNEVVIMQYQYHVQVATMQYHVQYHVLISFPLITQVVTMQYDVRGLVPSVAEGERARDTECAEEEAGKVE